MSSLVIRSIFSFLFLVILQVLILNNIQLGGFINPYIYVLFLLMLPLQTPRWASLFLGFALGLVIDVFSQTYGLHTAATLFMVYLRPFVLRFMAPRDDYEFGARPSIRDMGLVWFLSYAGVLVVIHHLALFFLEVFRFDEFLTTLLRAALSSVFSLGLIILTQFLTYSERKTT